MSYPRARRAARRSAYAKTAAFHLKLGQALAYYPPNHRDAEILRFWDTLAPYGFLPLANARVRRAAATALIDALLAHYSRVCQDRSVRTFLVTFAWDAGLTPITEPVLDMEAMERLVRRQLERLGLNAICAFDLDVFSKPNDGEEVRHLHMHVHALCWTRDPAYRPHTTAAKLRKGRAFPNRIGAPSVKFRSRAESAAQFAAFDRACRKRVRAKPVTASPNIARDRSRRDQTALSIANLAQYLLKDTAVSKNRYKGRDGRMRMRPEARRFTFKIALRFAEIFSEISPYDAVFGVGAEASIVTADYSARIRAWERRNRENGEFCDERELKAAWIRYFTTHANLGLAPCIIRQRRHTLVNASSAR